MATTGIKIFADNSQVIALLERLEEALSDQAIQTFFTQMVRPILQRHAEERFDTEGGSDGEFWADLKPSTLDRRALDGYPYPQYPINYNTGELRGFVTGAFSRTDWFGPGDATMVWPADLPTDEELMLKVKIAQEGRTDPSTAARPVIRMNSQTVIDINNALALALTVAV